MAFRCLTAYVLGAIMNECFMPLAGPGTAALAALPAGAFPFATETPRDAPHGDAGPGVRTGPRLHPSGLTSLPEQPQPRGASHIRLT